MIKKIAFGLVCLLFVACSDRTKITIPDNILSKEKMAAVMVDMHLLEASMNMAGGNPNKIDLAGSSVALNMDVLKKNNITKKQFDESFTFYSNNPQLLSEVYQLVLTELSKMQAEVAKSLPAIDKVKK